MSVRVAFLLLSVFCSCFCDVQNTSKNVLVLLENLYIRDTHSAFFNIITSRGYDITFKVADDPSLALMKYGEYLYSHIFILSPSVKEFGGSVSVKELIKFLDNGGNLLVAANSDVGESIRELGSECGIEFDEEGSSVIDHFNFDLKDDGKHNLLAIDVENLVNSIPITGGKVNSPLLYRGISISADPSNPLLIDILHGYKTSYGYKMDKPISDYPNTVGTNTQLITALQARNNARALFVGSIDFFSNQFFTAKVEHSSKAKTHPVSGNQELAKNLVLWVVGERGQLRYTSVEHHRVNESVPPNQYTIMDEVIYKIKIETKDDSGNWVPYDADDVQLEFVRIDPFIRKSMSHKNGEYSLIMKLPDVYGVFKFVVDYHRLGYTHLVSIIQIPVRPFTHTQYERFIDAAYPYYASAGSMMVGVLVFSFIFLYFKDDKEKSD